MKRTLNIALASAAIALPVLAVSLPLTESFDSGLGEFTVEDANHDGVTVKTLGFYGLNYSDGLQYAGSSANSADDWLFTPALSLRKGYVYQLTYQYKVTSSGTTNRIEWKAGKEASSGAMDLAVADAREYTYNYGSWAKETVSIQVPEDGDYHIGMHIISDAGQGTIYFDQIELPEGINGAAPVAPEVKAPVFAVNGEALQASFEITLPAATASGTDLSGKEIETTVTRSDTDTKAVVKGMAGTSVTYTDEDASTSKVTYTFSCSVAGVESPAVQVVSSPTIGTPKAVDNFSVTQDGNTFHLNWNAVTEPVNEGAIFIPSQVRYVVKCGAVTVADKIPELETEYTHPMPEEGQEAVSFSIMAVTGSQQSEAVKSRAYMVGAPYTGEFIESFANRTYDNKTWTVENDKNTGWQPSIGSSYSPVVNPQDNDGGCLQFYYTTQETLHIWSPVLDLSGLSNPKLKFWVYLQPSSYYDMEVQAGFLTGEEETLLGEPIRIKEAEQEGWAEFTYDMPEEALKAETQLFFAGVGGTYGKLFIDNISIKSYLAHNLAIEAAAPARHLEIGQEVSFSAEIMNKGVNEESDYQVILLADGEKVASSEGTAVNAMESVTVNVPFKVLPKYAGTDVNFTLAVEMDTDMDLSDNETEIVIPVNENDLVRVDGLEAKADNDNALVSLNWNIPQISSEPTFTETTESFEEWTAGSTEPENGWLFIDADGVAQQGINNVNIGEVFAAMVAESFTAEYNWNPSLESHDGSKCLAVTQAVQYYNTDTDNWVISPEVKGGTAVTFFASTFAQYGSPESFEIMCSEGGVTAEDFTLLTSASAPYGAWTEFSFELPAEATRFAIRVSGRHSNPLLLDSFTFTLKSEPAVLTGFNLYRDHELLCSLSTDKDSHVDANPVNGKEHTYHVTALYDKGESGYSEAARATVDIDSAVETISGESEATEYYDLNGIKIASPAKGHAVIMKKGTSTSKVIIN